MAKNTSIALSEHFQEFIRDQIASGEYETASEVVRDGLRLLERRKKAVDPIQAALNEALASGPAEEFDFAAFKRRMRRKQGK
jgi:antitoxin ParD1/3/4